MIFQTEISKLRCFFSDQLGWHDQTISGSNLFWNNYSNQNLWIEVAILEVTIFNLANANLWHERIFLTNFESNKFECK